MTRATPYGWLLEGETVRLMVSTSTTRKGGHPPSNLSAGLRLLDFWELNGMGNALKPGDYFGASHPVTPERRTRLQLVLAGKNVPDLLP